MQLRRDIQGLRGIAVLAVFLFHIGVRSIPGGYVGVDVFFVISGFLITSIIAGDIRTGSFSFSQFYNRRMKRLVPALQLMCLCTLLAGWYLLLPTSTLMLVKSLIASSLLASNIYFWRETTGYFGASSDELPLLHNWSLSIEEQFYLFWPLTLVVMARFVADRRIVLTVSALIVGSFLLGQWGTDYKATAAYFLLPTRAGEFLLGALLVFLPENANRSRPLVAQSLAFIGLVLILAPCVLLSASSRFPGFNALWPCLGAALVIDTGRRSETLVKSLLSFGPLVFFGTISYSLYLWHWPPIAFLHYFGIELSGLQRLGLFWCVVLVAWLSWRFVEQTGRRLTWRLPQSTMVMVVPLVLLQVGTLQYVQSGKPAFPGLEEDVEISKQCTAVSAANYPEACKLGDRQQRPSFALWGDSFAGALSAALDEDARRVHVGGYLFTLYMCPSVTHVVRTDLRSVADQDFSRTCHDYNTRTFNYLLSDPAIQTVVITSNYYWYLNSKIADGRPMVTSTQPGAGLVEEFRAMLGKLSDAHKRIIVVMPHPADKALFNAALRRAFVAGKLDSLALTESTRTPDAITSMIERLPHDIRIDRVYPHLLMCDADKCRVFDKDGELYLSDGAHVTRKMARMIVALFPPDWYLGQPPLFR